MRQELLMIEQAFRTRSKVRESVETCFAGCTLILTARNGEAGRGLTWRYSLLLTQEVNVVPDDPITNSLESRDKGPCNRVGETQFHLIKPDHHRQYLVARDPGSSG